MDETTRQQHDAERAGMRTWVRFLQAHAAVTRRLEAELQGECDISLGEYEALLQLDAAEDGSLRMSELASSLLLSRSGVTRLVDRLVATGDVERRTCPSDARGAFASITDAGRARLRAAAPVHARGVREHFLGRLPADEVEPLGRTLGRLVPADVEAGCRAAGPVPGPAVARDAADAEAGAPAAGAAAALPAR
jgi:DNA-binding MarR family transcriptional regulator